MALRTFPFPVAELSGTLRRDELFGLKDEVAMVIGATGAFGRAIAEGLGQAGARDVVRAATASTAPSTSCV